MKQKRMNHFGFELHNFTTQPQQRPDADYAARVAGAYFNARLHQHLGHWAGWRQRYYTYDVPQLMHAGRQTAQVQRHPADLQVGNDVQDPPGRKCH